MNPEPRFTTPPWVLVAWGMLAVLVVVVALGGSRFIGLSSTIGAGLALLMIVCALVLGVVLSRRRSPLAPMSAGAGVFAAAGPFLAAGVITLLVIQAVPYGRDHTNPPGTGEPEWSSPRTRELMVQACFGCHSNEVDWPWYANVAPISWAVVDHVEHGRSEVNYSNFATEPGEAYESVEVIELGVMPPAYYTRLGRHPEAKLSPTELEELIEGLKATPGMTRATKKEGSG